MEKYTTAPTSCIDSDYPNSEDIRKAIEVAKEAILNRPPVVFVNPKDIEEMDLSQYPNIKPSVLVERGVIIEISADEWDNLTKLGFYNLWASIDV